MRFPSINLLLFIISLNCQAQNNISYDKKSKATDFVNLFTSNEHNGDITRTLKYIPDGEDFVSINGNNRYTRALYGGHTEWRLETSDRPIFATYVKNDYRNISFRIKLPNGNTTLLDETTWCESRYTPGCRKYRLKDKSWGINSTIEITVVVGQNEERALWKFSFINFPKSSTLEALNAPTKIKKLSRNGDMGADPINCFDAVEDITLIESIKSQIGTKHSLYISIYKNKLELIDGLYLYNKYENGRKALANRIKIVTPDPYINTIGGAISVAADAIWNGQVWLHGAVGWRMPLNGWRAVYAGDALGWHDRARTHFNAYAASQVKDIPNSIPHPAQDSTLALARSLKKWGTPQYSNGYICRNPYNSSQMHHYDMNLCYIDELLWHLNWTGDLKYAREIWPVIKLHLEWEKRNFDPDNDGLYDAYASIWASDALYYNSGAVTHSSAYNYRANKMAAIIAEKIGEDPAPYRNESNKIINAINSRLWLKDSGYWAEFQDFMGYKRLHKDAAIWTIYHAIDSEIATTFQSYLATKYIDNKIPHIPIYVDSSNIPDNIDPYWEKRYKSVCNDINSAKYSTISTSNWMPYSWSINNVAFAEIMHSALSYFQASRIEEGYKLMKSAILDGMYLGNSPGNFGQVSFYDAARGECYRDFGDAIGITSRTLIQGLYGIIPDALNSSLVLKPSFPKEWKFASIQTPDIEFRFKREGISSKNREEKAIYNITHHLSKIDKIDIQIPAYYSRIGKITINGKIINWKLVENSVSIPIISLSFKALPNQNNEICIEWKGEKIDDNNTISSNSSSKNRVEGRVNFVFKEIDNMKWWVPTVLNKSEDESCDSLAKQSVKLDNIIKERCEPVAIDNHFNASVTDIFKNEYLSPRSPYTTLQIPKQGIGEWCHPLMSADIDDSGLRISSDNNIIKTEVGIPFRTAKYGKNIVYTSLWDNYPDSTTIVLNGKATSAYLLMAGSTNHMQFHMINGVVRIYYSDNSFETLPLINPYNWAPIEQLFFEDGKAFNRKSAPQYRLHLKSGKVSKNFAQELGLSGVSQYIDGGAAIILKVPLDSKKKLSHFTLSTISNDVVIGIMGITLQR